MKIAKLKQPFYLLLSFTYWTNNLKTNKQDKVTTNGSLMAKAKRKSKLLLIYENERMFQNANLFDVLSDQIMSLFRIS